MTAEGAPVTDHSVYPFPAKCPFELPDELARRRAEAPVAPVSLRTGATGWLVTRYADVRAVLSDERFSRTPVRQDAARRNNGPGFDFGASIASPERHALWRGLTGQVFHVRQAEAMRPAIGAIVEELLDELTTRQPADLMSGLAYRLPLRVLLEVFSVPEDLRQPFYDWAAGLRAAGSSMAAFGEAMNSLYKAAGELVDRPEPGGAVAELLAARVGGQGCDREMAVSTVLLMTVAGYETIATQLGNGFLALFLHPEQLDGLRADTVSVQTAVEEVLRYAQAGTGFTGMTYPTEDIELGGATIPTGAPVFISIDSAGRDEARVHDPETFDLSRGAARDHLTFGFGSRFCLGAPIARVELQETFARTLRRLPGLRPEFDVSTVEMGANMFSRYPKELPVSW